MTKQIKRRDFIKKIPYGLFGAGIGLNTLANKIATNNSKINQLKKKNLNPTQRPKVALIKGNDRKANMFEALKLIEDDIKKSIGNKQIVIKPNFTRVLEKDWLASTHVDNIWAILEFFEPFYKNKIIIAEGTGTRDPIEVPLKNYGYEELAEKYNVEFYDLQNGNNSRNEMHQGDVRENPKIFNYNLFRMSQYVSPDLGLIDGFVGMEGDGPLWGDPIEVGVAVASTDFLAADRVGAEIMEHDFDNLGHLVYCADAKMGEGDITKIDVIGEKIANCKKKFEPHKDWERLIRWK